MIRLSTFRRRFTCRCPVCGVRSARGCLKSAEIIIKGDSAVYSSVYYSETTERSPEVSLLCAEWIKNRVPV